MLIPEHIDDSLDIQSPVRPTKYRKILLAIDILDLDLLCAYVMNTKTTYITFATLSNIKNMLELMDMRFFETQDQKMARIHFIQEALRLRLDERINQPKIIKSMIYNRVPPKYRSIIENDIMMDATSTVLSKEEIRAINTAIIDKLLHGYILYYKGEFMRVFEKLESGSYDYLKNVIDEFKETLDALQNEIRQAETYIHENTALSLDNFDAVVMGALERINAPKNKLQVAIQYWNNMLSGGYESGRVYIHTMLTGVGKSNILLNALVQIRMMNLFLETKDPTKKPTILFVTQENSLDETIERLYNITVQTGDIRGFDKAEIIRKLKEEGGFTMDGGMMNVHIRYFPDRSISTSDLYGVIDNIEKTGYEVVCLIHDYIYRIKSTENHSEFRLELGAITNEFGNLAKYYGIPVITATQLNRKAQDMLEEALKDGKMDISKLINESHLAESWLMANNADYIIAGHKEMDAEGNSYYTFKTLKRRGRPDPNIIDYFAHPIETHGIKLLHDIGKENVLSKTTLANTDELGDVLTGRQAPISASNVTQSEDKTSNNQALDLSKILAQESQKVTPTSNKYTLQFNDNFMKMMIDENRASTERRI